MSTDIEGIFGLGKGCRTSWGWLYGEQVKEIQMWVTSSLPSQHNKAIPLYINFVECQKTGPGLSYPKRQDDGRLNNPDRQLGIKKKVSQVCEINRNS